MAVPYIFQNQVGPIPLSELDNNFSYFTDAITPSGGSINVFNSINAGTFLSAGSYLATGTYANIGSYLTTGTYLTVGTNLTVNGTTNFVGGVSIPSASLSGNLTFTSSGNRILGDFSNATTISNRVAFQTSTTNGSTRISAIPNGTGSTSSFDAYNAVDFANASFIRSVVTSTTTGIQSGAQGTGTYLPLTFATSGVEKMRLDTLGNLGIGTTSPLANTKATIYNNSLSGGTLTLIGDGFPSSWSSIRYQDAATPTNNYYDRYRGSLATPTAITSGDGIAQFNFRAYGGTTIRNLAIIYAGVGTYTSDTDISSYLSFYTSPTGSAAAVERMRIQPSGGVSIGNTTDPGATNLSVTGNGIFGTLNSTGAFGVSTTSTFTGLATFNGGATFVGNVSQTSGTYSFSNATGTYTIGATSGTSTITVGQSTVSQTTNIQAGSTASGSTKAINIGTGGLSGSTTTINIGSSTGSTSITFNGTPSFTTAIPTGSGGTGGATATAGFNNLSPVTSTGDLIIGNGANSNTRLAIGTSGYVLTSNGTTATWAAASPVTTAGDLIVGTGLNATTRIPIGTTGYVLTSNGTTASWQPVGTVNRVYTVATLPSASSSGAGFRSFVSDANSTTFASAVAGGGSNVIPVYSDGVVWRIG